MPDFCKQCREDGYPRVPERECYRHCHKATDGDHVPDFGTTSVSDCQDSDKSVIVDVNCKLCGRSGSTRLYADDIVFD